MNWAIVRVARRVYGWKRIKIGKCVLLGPQGDLSALVEVLEELQNNSRDIYNFLIPSEPITIAILNLQHNSSAFGPFFYIGNDFSRWGKAGLRAYLVSTAYCVKFSLHIPGETLKDNYSNAVLRREAARLTAEWLNQHDQPRELSNWYADLAKRKVAKRYAMMKKFALIYVAFVVCLAQVPCSASGNSEKPIVDKGYSTLPELFTSLDQLKDWLSKHDVTARFQTLEFRREDGEKLQVVFVRSFAYSGVPLIDLYVYIANASGYRLRLANLGVQSKPGLFVASQSGDYLVLTNGNTEYLKIEL